jgi:hypothetical protein
MTTRIIALIALLALLATPPPRITTTSSRTTGRTRRFKLARGRRANVINSFVNKSFCSSKQRERRMSLSLSALSKNQKNLCTRTKIFKNPHILVPPLFTKARTHNHAVRLSLPPSLLSFRRRSRCSRRSARTSQIFAFLSFAWYRARRCLFTRAFSFSFFFPLLFAREGSCRSKISDIVTFSL